MRVYLVYARFYDESGSWIKYDKVYGNYDTAIKYKQYLGNRLLRIKNIMKYLLDNSEKYDETPELYHKRLMFYEEYRILDFYDNYRVQIKSYEILTDNNFKL